MTPKEIIDTLDELRDIARTSELYDNAILVSPELCGEIINALHSMYDTENQEKIS